MLTYVIEAWSVLLEHRVRSLLTIVGIVVGVAAIIAVQIATQSMQYAVAGVLKGVNVSAFIVTIKSHSEDVERAALKRKDLTLIGELPGVLSVIPFQLGPARVRVGHQIVLLGIGGEAAYRFGTAPITQGRAINATDVAAARNVCTLSHHAYHRLFPHGGDALGHAVFVGDHRYIVIGVLGKARIATAAMGFNMAGDIEIPDTTYYNNYQRNEAVLGLQVLPRPGLSLRTMERLVKNTLSQAHTGSQYETFDLHSLFKSTNAFFGVVGLLGSTLGLIALVVAGIGIMNIMLVSVVERTKEIGVRRAIGAPRSQILSQFLIEAFLLSAIGCLFGLAFGVVIGWVASVFFIDRLSGVAGPIPWIKISILSVMFAAVITLVFGTYPACRAAQLDPIEALRYE